MKLILAPMEGLTDVHMRDLLTRIAGGQSYDWCVSEFIRVTDRLLPERVFYQYCPELRQGGRTRAGTPVHVQLLGSDPARLAENAACVAALGAHAIDLNFGCPAKTVNRHRGGAALLEEPQLLHDIVAAVRRAVPARVPVSAKMRLGLHNRDFLQDNAQAIASAGAAWLTVHARTRADGYRPPAYWDALTHVRAVVSLPLIANGDIVCTQSAARCRAESGCTDLMIGRGAVSQPDLVCRLRGEQRRLSWLEMLGWQHEFLTQMWTPPAELDPACEVKWTEGGAVGRYKQWLAMLTQGYPQAQELFAQVKRLKRLDEIRPLLLAAQRLAQTAAAPVAGEQQ